MTQMTKPRISTEIDGQQITLVDLAKTSTAIERGVRYYTICRRYRLGIRGIDLIAPFPAPKAVKERTEAQAQHELAVLRREARERRERTAAQREQARQDAMALARAEHEAEFSRPLIDRRLLTDEERWQAEFQAKGVQRWAPMGGWR